MKVVEDGEVPAFMGAKKMSLHQTGFQDVIATAQLMGICPERLCLIGVQPEELEDYGGGLRDIVAAQIDPAVDIGIAKLAQLGCHRRPKAAAVAHDLADIAIRRDAYEDGRPSGRGLSPRRRAFRPHPAALGGLSPCASAFPFRSSR
jgi:hydrogenase maturation protease